MSRLPSASLRASLGGRAALADLNARLTPARAAFRRGALGDGLRLFADAVGGLGPFDRRSAGKAMMIDNAAAHFADATTSKPRHVFTCDMTRWITAPTLVTRGERSPVVFHQIADELER